jgi:predicted kinase
MQKQPVLYIFSGLPATGKSTLSQLIAREFGAVHLRIDTIEQGLRDLCELDVQGEGYRLAYRIAADNLHLGMSVVADSCNPIELTRREWEQVALEAKARFINIEVVCSDAVEHKRRAESRITEVSGLTLPTWAEIVNREYHDWTVDRLVVDTAGKPVQVCAADLIAELAP